MIGLIQSNWKVDVLDIWYQKRSNLIVDVRCQAAQSYTHLWQYSNSLSQHWALSYRSDVVQYFLCPSSFFKCKDRLRCVGECLLHGPSPSQVRKHLYHFFDIKFWKCRYDSTVSSNPSFQLWNLAEIIGYLVERYDMSNNEAFIGSRRSCECCNMKLGKVANINLPNKSQPEILRNTLGFPMLTNPGKAVAGTVPEPVWALFMIE